MRVPSTSVLSLCGSLLSGLFALPSSAASSEPTYLFGSIGSAKVSVIMTREADGTLSGWYLYLERGKQIRLEGKVDAKGAFHLDESIDQAKTGLFEGTIDGTSWNGTWRKPEGSAAPLAVALHEAAAGDLDVKLDCATKTKIGDYTYRHSLKLTVKKGKVTRFDTQRDAQSEEDGHACSAGLSDFDQVTSPPGLLLQSKGETDEADAGPCRVRIIGDRDQLYVRMGAEEGSDCRGGGGTMFCAPNAFWTDMIVDRAKGRCRSVQ